eukprot:264522-Alexandrium_andersonii.AAC.1
MSASLVGSEMCIRDRSGSLVLTHSFVKSLASSTTCARGRSRPGRTSGAVSYTHLTLPTICSV